MGAKMNDSAIEIVKNLITEGLFKKSISLSELIAFNNEIENEIRILQDEIQENMIKEFREKAQANGISFEVLGNRFVKEISSKKTKETKTTLPPKYRNPNNENETWCGYGRKPEWVKKLYSYGLELEDYKI